MKSLAPVRTSWTPPSLLWRWQGSPQNAGTDISMLAAPCSGLGMLTGVEEHSQQGREEDAGLPGEKSPPAGKRQYRDEDW